MKTTDAWAMRHTADQCSRGHNINAITPLGKPNPNLVLTKKGRQCRRCTRLKTREAMRRLRAQRRAEAGYPPLPNIQCPDCLRRPDCRGAWRGVPWPRDPSAEQPLCPRCVKHLPTPPVEDA